MDIKDFKYKSQDMHVQEKQKKSSCIYWVKISIKMSCQEY